MSGNGSTLGNDVRIAAIVVFVAAFVVLKVWFLFRPPKALIFATVPALLLILAEPANAGSTSNPNA